MTDDELTLELGDRIYVIAERLGKPGAFSMDNPRLRNLSIIWTHYSNYLRSAMKKRPGPGYPIWLVEDSFMLNLLHIGPRRINRAWFEERPNGGTEIVWTHPYKEEGYQWWILSWKWSKKLLTTTTTHWMIDHDEDLKRSTVYFTRGFVFTEDPHMGDYPDKLATQNTILDRVSERHRRRVMDLARHATQHDTDEWVLTLATYGLFHTMEKLHNMIQKLDVGNLTEYWIDKEFKAFWFRRVLDALYDKEDWRPSRDQIDFDGLLKDAWYIPKQEHFLDRERFERVYQEWVKFREWYMMAHKVYLGVVRDERPFSEMVTDAQEPDQQ
jgi:hypothetical protein